MRLCFLPIIAVLASGGAWAQETGDASGLASKDLWTLQRVCKLIGDLSVTIMKQRQDEVPMSEMIGRARTISAMMGPDDGTGITEELVVAMVMAAYRQPAMSNPELQDTIISGFRNDIELQCFEGKLASSP